MFNKTNLQTLSQSLCLPMSIILTSIWLEIHLYQVNINFTGNSTILFGVILSKCTNNTGLPRKRMQLKTEFHDISDFQSSSG